MVVVLDNISGGDNFYAGVSASPEYDSFQNQQPVDSVSAEEQAAREQVWRAELAKVSWLIYGEVRRMWKLLLYFHLRLSIYVMFIFVLLLISIILALKIYW